jgi:hypothetical protein
MGNDTYLLVGKTTYNFVLPIICRATVKDNY